MLAAVTPARLVIAATASVVVLFAIGFATRDDTTRKPYLRILGGGFIFNYRVADNYYGFTAVVQRPLESGSVIEVLFEDPASPEPIIVRERVSAMTDRYPFRTPPLRGIEADRDYHVSIRVLDRLENRELETQSVTFRSQISDRGLSQIPLTIGPGYARNPWNEPR